MGNPGVGGVGMDNSGVGSVGMGNPGVGSLGMGNPGVGGVGVGGADVANNNNNDSLGKINLVFETKNKGQRIVIQVSPTDKVDEAIKKYISKSGNKDEARFIFSGKRLDNGLSISQAGLSDGSVIFVINTDMEGA